MKAGWKEMEVLDMSRLAWDEWGVTAVVSGQGETNTSPVSKTFISWPRQRRLAGLPLSHPKVSYLKPQHHVLIMSPQ